MCHPDVKGSGEQPHRAGPPLQAQLLISLQGRSQDRVSISTPQQRGWAELCIHTCSRVFLKHQLQGSSKAQRHWQDPLLVSSTRRKSSNFYQIQHPTRGKVLTSGVCTPQTGWGCPGAFSSLLHLALRGKGSLTGKQGALPRLGTQDPQPALPGGMCQALGPAQAGSW